MPELVQLRVTHSPEGVPVSLVRTGNFPDVRFSIIDNTQKRIVNLRPGSSKDRAIEVYHRYVHKLDIS